MKRVVKMVRVGRDDEEHGDRACDRVGDAPPGSLRHEFIQHQGHKGHKEIPGGFLLGVLGVLCVEQAQRRLFCQRRPGQPPYRR
jgi:hypothetical protein